MATNDPTQQTKGSEARATKSEPLVSVVVPTRNSAATLPRTLGSVRAQTYHHLELIVVDNFSTDDTAECARQLADVVVEQGPERTAQVNLGAQIANGKYLYYLGSDLVADPTLIQEAVAACEGDGYDAIYLNVRARDSLTNIWQRARALERRCYEGETNVHAARFYRREKFLELGGMDESIGAVSDDFEMQHRLDLSGARTGMISAGEVTMSEYASVGTIARRSLYYGWQLRRFQKKYPERFRELYRPVRREFLGKRHLLLESKADFLALLCYKAIQYLFGGVGMLVNRLSGDNLRIERLLFRVNYGNR